MRTAALVLVCDDDEDDLTLIREAFAEARLDLRFQFVQNGIALLEYLQGESPRPDIILLDLNMPKMGGMEALTRIKSNLALRAIPIVIYTTSTMEEDVLQCYELGANSYMTKCTTFDELVMKAKSFSHYWLDNALLPRKDAGVAFRKFIDIW